jgi:hypothetical protein
MSKINWNKDKPNEIGTHFVAIKYGEGAGTFDFVEWDGNQWITEFEGNVIAYLTLEELVKNIPFEWPESSNNIPEKSKPLSNKSENMWEEM